MTEIGYKLLLNALYKRMSYFARKETLVTFIDWLIDRLIHGQCRNADMKLYHFNGCSFMMSPLLSMIHCITLYVEHRRSIRFLRLSCVNR